MSSDAPMAAPRGGWLIASIASFALLALASTVSAGPLDTLTIDLRHRWVAVSSSRPALPAEAIADLVLGELRKLDDFPASGASITVYGYRHWNAMITFAPFSTTFRDATRFRQAIPDLDRARGIRRSHESASTDHLT